LKKQLENIRNEQEIANLTLAKSKCAEQGGLFESLTIIIDEASLKDALLIKEELVICYVFLKKISIIINVIIVC
jgi:hypothetical protein